MSAEQIRDENGTGKVVHGPFTSIQNTRKGMWPGLAVAAVNLSLDTVYHHK